MPQSNAHSWFPPSSAYRSIRCPGSIKAIAALNNPDTSNKHAEMGTECHDAMCWAVDMNDTEWDRTRFTDPDNQIEACEIAYAALQQLVTNFKPDKMLLEHRVTLLDHSDIFGTVDVILYNSVTRKLVIVDYKFGYNEVDPVGNEQLMTYALGALDEFDVSEADVYLSIIQPKQQKEPLVWRTTELELLDWYKNTLLPAIVEAEEGKRFEAGPQQCKFCPVASHGCKYQTQQYITALEDFQPQDAYRLDDAKLSKYLTLVPAMKDAIKALEKAAIERLKGGSEELRKRYKLVKGKTNRKWVDEQQAVEWFEDRRFLKGDYLKEKLISPAQGEKLAKTKKLRPTTLQKFSSIIEKPEGALTYAPLADKRAAVEVNEQQAIEDARLDDLF